MHLLDVAVEVIDFARRANHCAPVSPFVQPLTKKYFAFSERQISCIFRAVPFPIRGAFRDRHERWELDAMDALVCETKHTDADGKAVWSWRPDAGVKSLGDDPKGDGG